HAALKVRDEIGHAGERRRLLLRFGQLAFLPGRLPVMWIAAVRGARLDLGGPSGLVSMKP
ncbi:MAG: hypothetical protein R3C16_13470, partial [Hyphomonadaceae bacterium]